jgi:hypothetical protein
VLNSPFRIHRVSKILALDVLRGWHLLDAVRKRLLPEIGSAIPNRGVGVWVLDVADDRLIEQVVAEACAVSGVTILLSPIGCVLGVVGSLGCVVASRCLCTDLMDLINLLLGILHDGLIACGLLLSLLRHLLIDHLLILFIASDYGCLSPKFDPDARNN